MALSDYYRIKREVAKEFPEGDKKKNQEISSERYKVWKEENINNVNSVKIEEPDDFAYSAIKNSIKEEHPDWSEEKIVEESLRMHKDLSIAPPVHRPQSFNEPEDAVYQAVKSGLKEEYPDWSGDKIVEESLKAYKELNANANLSKPVHTEMPSNAVNDSPADYGETPANIHKQIMLGYDGTWNNLKLALAKLPLKIESTMVCIGDDLDFFHIKIQIGNKTIPFSGYYKVGSGQLPDYVKDNRNG